MGGGKVAGGFESEQQKFVVSSELDREPVELMKM